MRKYIRIGVDIAKNSFQVHALESEDCSATKRKLSRSGIVKFLAEVQPSAEEATARLPRHRVDGQTEGKIETG